MYSRFYTFQLVFIVISYITNVASQRTSYTKCSDYSAIPNNSTNRYSHLAIWIRHANTVNQFRLIESLQAEHAILISESYLLSATDVKKDEYGKVYFTIDESHSVIEIIKYHVKSGLQTSAINSIVLLKIRPIHFNDNIRPACLWAQSANKPHLVEILIPILPISCRTVFGCPEFENVLSDCRKFEMQVFNRSTNDCFPNAIREASSWLCLEKGQNVISRVSRFVQIYDYENHFIYGMTKGELDNSTNYLLAERFTLSIIDWIESEVWQVENFQTIETKSCGIVHPDLVPHILHPRETYYGEFPWHAALYYLTNSGDRSYQCGGSLITNNMVITAAHCLTSSEGTKLPSEILVILGKYDFILTWPESRESRVVNVIIHDDYNYNTFENDIALLKLETGMVQSNYIQTICLTNNSLIFVDPGVLPGWGLNEKQVSSSVLVQASFPIQPKESCRGNVTYRSAFSDMVNENNLCMGYQNGTALCSGDSGGGLVYKSNNVWFLRGIASTGESVVKSGAKVCSPLGLNLFTDVSKFYEWIMDHIN